LFIAADGPFIRCNGKTKNTEKHQTEKTTKENHIMLRLAALAAVAMVITAHLHAIAAFL